MIIIKRKSLLQVISQLKRFSDWLSYIRDWQIKKYPIPLSATRTEGRAGAGQETISSSYWMEKLDNLIFPVI